MKPMKEGYAHEVIEALRENGDPVSIDAAELLEEISLRVNSIKPMTNIEIADGFDSIGFGSWDNSLRGFIEGVRFAERHHGIGE